MKGSIIFGGFRNAARHGLSVFPGRFRDDYRKGAGQKGHCPDWIWGHLSALIYYANVLEEQNGPRTEDNTRETGIRRCQRLQWLAVGPILLLLFLFSNATAVWADDATKDIPTGFWERNTLLGDIGGLRTLLKNYGITFSLSETSEVLGNLTGGIRRGADYEGATTMALSLDTSKAFHWAGGTFYVSALQIHGRSLSADNLGIFHTVSGIEAERTTRLWELWFQQAFANGKADVKIGQQGVDQELIISQCCSLYLNAMTGWPVLPAVDLYAGGPAFPLSSPAIRVRVRPNESLTLLGGVFDDNPPGGPFDDDSQLRDNEASGTRFNMTTGALFIGEIQYAAKPACG